MTKPHSLVARLRSDRDYQIRIVGIGVIAIVFAALAFHRRWMSDDGLIVLRTVRQLLDGNGPVFNAFERAEASTSALWTYLLAALGAVTRAELARLAIYTGLALWTAAVVIGMVATARLRSGDTPAASRVVPGSVLVLVGVYPFWDFATSGLETSLCLAWLASCWWSLVTLDRSRLAIRALVFGLGPLVRPDLGIISITFLAAAWFLERPPWRRTLALAGIAAALPLAYEIFRAGYYGTLVPLPALAKSASEAAWSRGFVYLRDYLHPYMLWVPFAAIIALAIVERRQFGRRERVIAATPIIAGLILAIYVVRVGGDFMHARMFLAPTFLLLLPSFMVPLRKRTAPVAAVLAVWAIAIAVTRGDGMSHVTAPLPVTDERVFYVGWTQKAHPIDPHVFVRATRPAPARLMLHLLLGERRLLSEDLALDVPMNPAYPAPLAYAAIYLGASGAAAAVNVIVVDQYGLANPLGARITKTVPGKTGHEKPLPRAWLLADYADPAAEQPPDVQAARRAMQCGELAELLESVRAPLTLSRFWANLTGSLRRTRLVIPADPVEAERRFCGEHSR